jgi:hypothetical protein
LLSCKTVHYTNIFRKIVPNGSSENLLTRHAEIQKVPGESSTSPHPTNTLEMDSLVFRSWTPFLLDAFLNSIVFSSIK